MNINLTEQAEYITYFVIYFPLFLLALNSVLQVATRAICRQIWKTRWEMTNKGTDHG